MVVLIITVLDVAEGVYKDMEDSDYRHHYYFS